VDKSKNYNTSLPTLSVLITNYNDARFISEALESVLNQSYKPKEIIVIDDASTDNSVEIIKQYEKRETIIRLIQNEKNVGVISSINYFLSSIVSSEYFLIIGAHDRLLPGFFEKSMKLLARYPEAGVCSALCYLINEEGRKKGFFITPIVSTKECFIKPETAMSIVNKIDGYIPGHTAIYKLKALLDTLGCYKPELHAAADAFAAKVIVCLYGACFIPEALVCIRMPSTSYSRGISKNSRANKEIWCAMETLMINTYKKIFTKRHVGNCKSMLLFQINYLSLLDLQNKEIDFLKENIPPRNILEKRLFSLIIFTTKLEKLLYYLYTFAYSKRRICPVLYNRLFRTLHFRLLYFVSKMRRKMSR